MSIILFPHSQLPENEIMNILVLFGSMKIFRPWYMGKHPTLEEFADKKYINLIDPPETFRPREELKILLSEYYTWIGRNQDKSYMEILKRDQGQSSNEDATWEIRHLMRQMGQSAKAPEEDKIFNWHLILHLANEIETQSLEAKKLFRILKDREPLLDGSVEGVDPLVSPLSDLPNFTPETLFHKSQVIKIMDAWFGLFGEYLGDSEMFITIDHRILDHFIEMWDSISYNNKPITDYLIKFKIPDLSDYFIKEQDEKRSNKNEFDNLDVLRSYISKLGEDPVVNLHDIEAWSNDFEPLTSSEFQSKFIDISLIKFPRMSEKDLIKGYEFLEYFLGNTLILMEQS